MKRFFHLLATIMFLSFPLSGQEFDVTFTNTESGNQSHAARNSVTLGPGYTYTPGGGTLTVEIQNPIVSGAVSYTSSPVDPEIRSLNTSYLPGATSGSFSVNPAGGANYTIPLELLPGVNGIAPELSIVYSSNSGPGIAGFGWQIGGLSVIGRGPQTYYHDNAVSGVGLTTLDRFYLDGQRLVPTSGNYGDAGATYQTDNDIFTRVSQQATTTYGPGWFKAETKSGLVCEYGNTTGSKHQIPGFSQIVNWHISKVSDLFGNQINYAYIQDNCTVYPAEITYGPNTVTFYYKERSDKTSGYLRGVKIQQCLLLDRITVKYNTNVVKTYEFKYASQGPYYNKYSTLNEVIEYGAGTSRYNSTAINYQIPANVNFALTMDNTDNLYVSYNSFLVSGDYDGNGKSDFLCIPDPGKGASWTGLRVYYGDGNFYFPTYGSESTGIDLSVLKDIQSVDINGDGRDDILYEILFTTGGINFSWFFYLLNDGTPFAAPVLIYQQTFNQVTGFPGKRRRNTEKQEDDNLVSQDFNGDGVNDILIIGPGGTWRIYSFVNSSGQLTSSLNLLGNGTISTLANEALSGDFNGDGKSDIWSFEETGLKIYTYSGGSYMTLLYSSTWPSKRHFFNLGDYNGDGKIDVFLYGSGRDATEYDWTEWQIQLSTGTGFEGFLFPAKKTNLKDDLVRQGDFNGDGSADIMASPREISWSGSKYYISKNNGTDFYYHQLPTYPPASQNVYLTDLNGDARTEFITTDASVPYRNGYQVFSNPGNTSVLMEKIADGLGVLTKPSYIRLSQASSGIYQRGSGSVYPVSDFQGPMTVVSSVLVDNGKGSMNTQNYYYEGAKIHLRGKGFLGYTKSGISDVASAIASENIIINGFHSTYFYPQIQMSLRKISGTSDTIEKIKNTMTHLLLASETKRIFIYPQVSVTTNNKTGHKVTVTTSSYDNYGNPGSIVKTYLGGPTETVTSQYNNTVSSSLWLLGRPTSATLQFSKSGENTITRTGTRVFSSTSNNLSGETWYSGTGNQFVKGFKYNTNGSLKRDSITAGGVYRTNIYTYETNGVRIKTITDPLSHTTTSTYDNYGRLSTRADYLGNTLTYTYDDMGREATISSTDGNQTATTFTWEIPASVLKTARFSVLKTGNDGSQAKSWFDKLGREIRSDVKGFDGTWIYTDTRYNIKGQVDSISEPYYTGPLWNRYQYDNYGRKTSLNRPSGRNTTWTYSSNVITETTAGRSYHKTYSSDGTVSSAEDPGGTIYYTYYPDGKVKTITAPGTILTQMQYDIAGNQTKLIDPSAGTINYTYNGFGELLTQQNAILQTTTNTYYSDGRIARKVTPDGTTRYRYNSNKQLANVNSYGTVSHTYGYDSKGRVTSVIDTIPGTTPLTTSYTYDALGRNSTLTHPSGLVETNNYNSFGYLFRIDGAGSAVWTTSSINARGQITSGQYGTNLSAGNGYDSFGFRTSITAGANNSKQNFTYGFNATTGNLSWRQNNNGTDLKETFDYDNLDRLDNVYKGISSPVMTLDMAYDSEKGGITTKTDVGTLLYNLSGRPYAVSHINPVTSVVPEALDSCKYTSFESVSTIEEGAYFASFTYNPEDQRAKMEVKQNGSVILTRWYLGSNYIKETSSGVTKEYTFIGGNAYTAPAVSVRQSGVSTTYYLLRDHLGSITHVVNASTGSTTYEYSYDAWGRMRNTTNWTNFSPGSEPALFIAGRGFTGHEHLPWFNLINMNGRIYDPLVGQFLSPDNNVQSSDFTQNFNRYAYCLNNPLIYTDPSGELAWFVPIIIGAAIFGTANLTAHAIRGDVNCFGDGLKYFGQGALSGAALGAAWQFAPLFPWAGPTIRAGMNIYGYTQIGGAALSTVSGLGQGLFSGDWSALGNAGKIFLGNFYLDENRGLGASWQGFSRHTWEFIQTGLGYSFAQIRNTFGAVDNVEYFGGATLSNRNRPEVAGGGMTLGPFILGTNLEASTNDWTFMHEYGHTIQSRVWGPGYGLFIAPASGLDYWPGNGEGPWKDNPYFQKHEVRWYETGANRYAARYFDNFYDIEWRDIRNPRSKSIARSLKLGR